jgi:hypothetical protein
VYLVAIRERRRFLSFSSSVSLEEPGSAAGVCQHPSTNGACGSRGAPAHPYSSTTLLADARAVTHRDAL